MQFFSLKLCFCLVSVNYFVYTQNIIRVSTERFAKFVLRYTNKVPVKEPFYELECDCVEKCLDRCVAKPMCKSINYNNDKAICQLLDYDINSGNNYTEKAGWNHFDTGRTRLTKILDYNENYCLTPGVPDSCNPNGRDSYPIHYKIKTSGKCKGLESWFDFDYSSGVLVHFCSGFTVTISGENVIAIPPAEYAPKFYSRWRITELEYLAFQTQPAYPQGNIVGDDVPLLMAQQSDITKSQGRLRFTRGQRPVRYKRPLEKTLTFEQFEFEARKKMLEEEEDERRLNDFYLLPCIGKNHFFVQMVALFSPDATGIHSFWFKGDDWAMLFMGEKTNDMTLVATMKSTNGIFKGFNSGTIDLVKDKMYHIEVLYYQNRGGETGGSWLILDMVRPGDVDKISVSLDYLYAAPDD